MALHAMPPSPRSSVSAATPALRSRASSIALSSPSLPSARASITSHPLRSHPQSLSPVLKSPSPPSKSTNAWMQKLRRWKSRDDGLWGCAGDDIALDAETEEVYVPSGESKAPLPPLPEKASPAQYGLAYHESYSDTTSDGSSTSSQRSSMRSSTHSARSRSSGQTSPSIASVSSMSRQDLLAREQEGAIEAITSYMARTQSFLPGSNPMSPQSPSLSTSPRLPGPHLATKSGPYDTIRPSDFRGSIKPTRPRADTHTAFVAPPSASTIRRSPSMQHLRTTSSSSRLAGAPPLPPLTADTAKMLAYRPSLCSAGSKSHFGPEAGGLRRTSGSSRPSLSNEDSVIMYEFRGVDKTLYAQAQSTERCYSFI